MICLVDMMATIAALVNVPLPDAQVGCEDSFSFLPALLGKSTSKPSRETLVLHSGNGTFAVRKGRWKWIEGIPAKGRGKTGSRGVEELYDLDEDPGEKVNLIQARPEVANELGAFLNKTRGEEYSRPGQHLPAEKH